MRRWSLYKEKGLWTIRCGKTRHPIARYRRIRDDEALLRAYVIRLNAPIQAREAVQFRHALIDDERLADYQTWLNLQVPNQFNARAEFRLMKKHFLDYFIGKLDLKTPDEWLRAHSTKWATYLLNDSEVPKSPKSKRAIVQAANRFLKWMHEHYPEFMPALRLAPFGKAAFKNLKGTWEQNESRLQRSYIKPEHWELINKHLPADEFGALVRLAYHYGLRRRECQGVRSGDVKNEYLAVGRQLLRITPELTYGALKGRESRRVPHWFARAGESHLWVDLIAKSQTRLTPTQFSREWDTFISNHNLKYRLHDLRHTFITRAVRAYPHVDVMRAAGHKNIETTMAYLHDDRGFGDDEYRPAS